MHSLTLDQSCPRRQLCSTHAVRYSLTLVQHTGIQPYTITMAMVFMATTVNAVLLLVIKMFEHVTVKFVCVNVPSDSSPSVLLLGGFGNLRGNVVRQRQII